MLSRSVSARLILIFSVFQVDAFQKVSPTKFLYAFIIDPVRADRNSCSTGAVRLATLYIVSMVTHIEENFEFRQASLGATGQDVKVR